MSRPPLRRSVAALGFAVVLLVSEAGCASNSSSEQSDVTGPTVSGDDQALQLTLSTEAEPAEPTESAESTGPADDSANQSPGVDASDGDHIDQVGQVTSLDCGVPIDVLQSTATGLAMTGQFPPGADRGGDGTFTGSVTVTGAGVAGVASPDADVYVVQAGMVVSTPGPKDSVGQQVDLGSAAGATFTAPGSIASCESGEPLPAGSYDIYAAVVVNQADGSVVIATGGPWPLAIN
jgi:hypothetical protein